jgi:hypothetical protein
MPLLGRMLMVFGALLGLIGLVLYLAPSIPFLGKLPGDIRIERPNLKIYFPIMTCLLLSALLSGLLYLFSRLR